MTTPTTTPRRSTTMVSEAEDPLLMVDDLEAPGPIGVPRGYLAVNPAPQNPAVAAQLRAAGVDVNPNRPTLPPAFMDGDEWAPASQPPDRIAEWQRAMAQAGALTGKYRLGIWDDATRDAYRSILAFANQIGESNEVAALRRWSEADVVEEQREPFKALPFRPVDPAAVRQKVKATMTDLLGRDPRESEIETLAAQYEAFMRQDHDAAQGAARMAYDGEAGTVADVDPDARLRELLAERYRPEMDFTRRQDDTADQQAFLGQALRNMSSIIGGSG
jgi:hypothetical protein